MAIAGTGMQAQDKESNDSTAIKKVEVKPAPTELEQLQAKEIVNLKTQMTQLNQKCKFLDDQYRDEILKEGDLIKENKAKQDSIVKLQADNQALLKKLVGIASNFLYIPYDKYSIEQIAIPAFEMAQGTPLYDSYSYRLELLRSYRQNIQELISFLAAHERFLKAGLEASRRDFAKRAKDELTGKDFYKKYKAYPKGENTLLGKKIVEIENLLSTYPETTSQSFVRIRESLESMLAQ